MQKYKKNNPQKGARVLFLSCKIETKYFRFTFVSTHKLLMNRFLVIAGFLAVYFGTTFAQSVGDWRLHFNYENSIYAVVTPDKVYSATEDAILVFDKEDNSIRTYDKSNALSDIGVSALGYSVSTGAVIIAYTSSNIDLIKGNTFVNMPDIKNDISSGSKTVNGIFTSANLAYLSTDFGIVVLDIDAEEILSTYIIGSSGNPVAVYDCTIYNDTIYAITAEGIKRAPLSSPNLLDFSNWDHFIVGAPFFIATHIETFQNSLFVVADNVMYEYNDGVWDDVFELPGSEFISLRASSKLAFALSYNDDFKLYYTDGMGLDSLPSGFSIAPRSLVFDGEVAFVSDYALGLMEFANGNVRYLKPSSNPFSSRSFRVSSSQNRVFVSAGGFTAGVDPLGFFNDGFYFLEKNRWRNINKFSTPGYESFVQDITVVKQNPVTNLVYAGSMKGLLEYDFEKVKVYTDDNSPIEPAIGNSFFQMVTALDFDREGNTWMINAITQQGLKVKTKEGQWFAYDLGEGPQKYFILFVDSYGNKWLSRRNEGVIVFNEGADIADVANFNFVKLTVNPNNGNLPNNIVNTITQDKNGAVWVGTNQGVAVFDCPNQIFDPTSPCRISRRVKSTLDEYTEFLFDNDAVRAITIDGANRKWMGTESGVWLLSATGEDEILSFNTNNSPLPSNRINDIAINNETGEVFIATELGLASYFGDATEGANDHSNLKAFPNPVKPDYSGFISITGLVDGSFVKITDTRGVLIHEGFALGGKYIWDGNDFSGRRAKTGVYFIFSSNPDGTEKASTKIAFVN
jgi:hypothetical protein